MTWNPDSVEVLIEELSSERDEARSLARHLLSLWCGTDAICREGFAELYPWLIKKPGSGSGAVSGYVQGEETPMTKAIKDASTETFPIFDQPAPAEPPRDPVTAEIVWRPYGVPGGDP